MKILSTTQKTSIGPAHLPSHLTLLNSCTPIQNKSLKFGKKSGLFRETFHQTECTDHLRRWECPRNMMWLVFMGWIISYADKWEDYSIILFWGRDGNFQELGPYPLFGLWWLALELSWHLWVCHLACWCVTMSMYCGSRFSGSHLPSTLDSSGF